MFSGSVSPTATADVTGQDLHLVLCRQRLVNSRLFSSPNVLLVVSTRVHTAAPVTMSPSGQSSCVTGTVYTTETARWGKEGSSQNITSSLKIPAMVF